MESTTYKDLEAHADKLLQLLPTPPYKPVEIARWPPLSLRRDVGGGRLRLELTEGLTCPEVVSQHLDDILQHALDQLAARHRIQYDKTAMMVTATSRDSADCLAWTQSLKKAFERSYARAAGALRDKLVETVRVAQLRHSTPSPSPRPPEAAAATTTLSGHFTPAITALLQSAFNARKFATGPLNKGEKRELARATGLTEKQVITWFGNARQREKKRRDREASTGGAGTAATPKRSSARAVPYSLEMAPQHRRWLSAEQRYPSTMRSSPEQQQQPEERRTWSLGSSTLSSSTGSFDSSTSSLDLVEYAAAESGQGAAPAESTFVLPAPAPTPATKIQLDVSAALDPSGWFSIASSTPSPPSTMLVDPPHELQEEPFLSLPAPAPEAAGHLLPSASSPIPSSSWSHTAAISPTPSFEMPTPALVSDEPLPYVPAPIDAWMDDEFYRNLFGSLGFEMEVGIGVDGFLGGNGGPADASSIGGGMGGLTLRMDELQRM